MCKFLAESAPEQDRSPQIGEVIKHNGKTVVDESGNECHYGYVLLNGQVVLDEYGNPQPLTFMVDDEGKVVRGKHDDQAVDGTQTVGEYFWDGVLEPPFPL